MIFASFSEPHIQSIFLKILNASNLRDSICEGKPLMEEAT